MEFDQVKIFGKSQDFIPNPTWKWGLQLLIITLQYEITHMNEVLCNFKWAAPWQKAGKGVRREVCITE